MKVNYGHIIDLRVLDEKMLKTPDFNLYRAVPLIPVSCSSLYNRLLSSHISKAALGSNRTDTSPLFETTRTSLLFPCFDEFKTMTETPQTDNFCPGVNTISLYSVRYSKIDVFCQFLKKTIKKPQMVSFWTEVSCHNRSWSVHTLI